MSRAISRKARLSWAMLAVLLAAAIPACGKKGPPAVPGQKPLPVVDNLTVARQGKSLILEWSLSRQAASGKSEPAGFAVYRAEIPAGSGCPDCPVRYEEIGRVVYQGGPGAADRWYFADDAGCGGVCRYRVRCYGGAGRLGAASNTAEYVSESNGGS